MSQQAKQNNPRKDKNFRKDRTHTGDHSNDNKSSLDGPAGKPNPKLNKKRQGNLLDDKKEQAEFKAILDKISAEKKKIDEISDKIKSFKELRQGVKNNRGQGNNQKKTLLNQRKELLDQLTELKHQKNILQDALSSFKLPISKKKDQSLEDHVAANVAEFQNQINEIERSIQMDSLSLMEEKRKIGELEKVRKTKNQVDEYRKKATEISVYNEQIKAKNEELNKLKVELDEIFAAEKIQNEEKDKQRKSEEEKQAYYQSLIEQKRKHLDNVKQFKEESVAKKAEIDAKWDAWKKEQAVLREKRKEEYLEQKAERERQKKEYEELKQKKIQEEEAERKREEESKLPFCDEIASADELLNYLATYRYPKNKPNQVLKHSLDSYVSFEKFSINPPATAKDIEPVKAKIQQKKDDFLEKQKAEVVRREELKKQQAENEPKPEEQVDEKPAETPAEQAAETPSN